MWQRRVKQYKKVIKKELIKSGNDILFRYLQEIRQSKLSERIKIALWIIKGEKSEK